MKKYIKPNLEKIYIESTDIIKTSGEMQSFELIGTDAGTVDFSTIMGYANEPVNLME